MLIVGASRCEDAGAARPHPLAECRLAAQPASLRARNSRPGHRQDRRMVAYPAPRRRADPHVIGKMPPISCCLVHRIFANLKVWVGVYRPAPPASAILPRRVRVRFNRRRTAAGFRSAGMPPATRRHLQMDHGVSTNAPGMTSLLERDPDTQAFFNNFAVWGEVERTVPVHTVRLDACGEVKDIDYLKMDAQGSELMILEGGQGKLSHCVVLQTEVSFITLYKLQPTFGEIDCYLRKYGFAPHCFAELKRWSIAPTVKDGNFRIPFNQLLEADAVYIRDTIHERLDVLPLKKIAVIAHYCYASYDLAARCIIDLCARGAVSANAQQRYYDSLHSPN